ncbi:N-acyl amino acid synthase FeeM domain-containing protein [Mucilaginibacter sp. UYCu711]|uniref:N-acyl amino acid synthase FeeM domain-containing protein n=1 Tax=Mucilaginibacter sp. UYCu711 TaxID=3156339 RepID=UPI003D22BB72
MNNNYVLNPCETEKEISDAIKLRYIAYRNVDAIDVNEEKTFKDKYDLLNNSKTCLIYEQGAAVASIRACVYSKEHNFMHIPAFEVYKEEIEKEIGLDKVIIEANRFVIDPAKVDSKHLFKIPFRFIMLNILKFSSDNIITAGRPKHVPLYRRFLGLEPISEPKKYPGINVEMIIMVGECKPLLKLVMEREEIYRFTDEEVDNYKFTPTMRKLPEGIQIEPNKQQKSIL